MTPQSDCEQPCSCKYETQLRSPSILPLSIEAFFAAGIKTLLKIFC